MVLRVGSGDEETLHDTPVFREFAKIDQGVARLPDEMTILRFRHLLERHNLAPDMLRLVNDILGAKGLLLRTGTVVDATLIAAPSSSHDRLALERPLPGVEFGDVGVAEGSTARRRRQ